MTAAVCITCVSLMCLLLLLLLCFAASWASLLTQDPAFKRVNAQAPNGQPRHAVQLDLDALMQAAAAAAGVDEPPTASQVNAAAQRLWRPDSSAAGTVKCAAAQLLLGAPNHIQDVNILSDKVSKQLGMEMKQLLKKAGVRGTLLK